MISNNIEIRIFGIGDLSAICKFYQSVSYESKKNFHPIFLNNSRRTKSYFIHRILFSISSFKPLRYLLSKINLGLIYQTYILQDKSDLSLIGFSYLKNKRSKGNNKVASFGIVIHDKYQGKGYGRKLIDYTLNRAKKMKLKQIKLTVLEENLIAVEFYKKVGFTILNVVKNKDYWDGVHYNDVEMIYNL